MRQLGVVHVLFARFLLIRLHPSDGENAQGRGFTGLPFLHIASPTYTRTIPFNASRVCRIPNTGEKQAAINNRREEGWQLFLSPA
ncbi:hypothetical protein FD644_22235 [Serratia fonticola]|nr:hypothetical protein D9980_15600 [Serratia sp. 3ACOL1]NTY85998.1 hypothetical protein [Serratia fonticola]NTZ11888.1 hypothetical protein [Serratia fonticola]QCR62897.1 hypothetical protein FD644_22235 [Serratia fonticola]